MLSSITGRLTLLYTLSAVVILLISNAYLYWTLTTDLEKEESQFLADEVRVLRAVLLHQPADANALRNETQWKQGALRFEKVFARIADHSRNTVVETPGMTDILPASLFPDPVAATEEPDEASEWRSPKRRTYLLAAAWAELGPGGGKEKLLQVALDVSRERRLVAAYRRKLGVVLSVGLLLSAAAGIAVARRGMRPIQAITRTVQRVTSVRLGERVAASAWPRELAALAAAFDGMFVRLEDSFNRLSQFSADLAHELRTPIHNLMGEAEVAVSRARSPEEYRQVLESSLEEYSRIMRMIDSLLFLARAEGSSTRIEREPVDTRKEIEAVREFYEALAADQGVTVTCEGNACIEGDPILFRRAVSNLLSNSLRYTPRGGNIRVSVEPREGRGVTVQVNDTGSGIAPEHLPKIFDRFYRADRARSHESEGTGLGLAIVKSIVELHGGSVSIQSETGRGTTVTLVVTASPTSAT